MIQNGVAYFEGKFVPLAEAKVSIMVHAFNYGTGIYEGIRGYHNSEEKEIYLFRLAEHFVRMVNNCRILKVEIKHSVDELCALATELVRLNKFECDVYVRPIAYKNACQIGTKLTPGADFTMFSVEMGDYIDTSRPLSICVSSWRRVSDNAIPARAKICGSYVNSALAATEARDNGFDESIVLNEDGEVAEGAAMNLFIVRNGKLITTPVYSNILEGITRDTLVQLADKELGLETEFRPIDRSELYISDEAFLCGTGAQVASVGSIDHRPLGNGKMGVITTKLQKLYGDVVRGKLPQYSHWLTPSYNYQSSTITR